MGNFIHTRLIEYLSESEASNKRFVVDEKNSKFELLSEDVLVAESGFNVESPDEWFNEKYITLYNLKTTEGFQGKGFARYLLEQIFDYVKDSLNLNIIALIVDKDNHRALNLYRNNGFDVFMEYDDSFSLIKRLN